jgi:GMP synthase-like glutamine amidotransferase
MADVPCPQKIHQMHRDIVYSPLPDHLLASASDKTATNGTNSSDISPTSTANSTPAADNTAPLTSVQDDVPQFDLKVEVLGQSPTCEVQSLYTPNKLITVQGHPEFNQEIMTEILTVRHKAGVFGDEAYEKYMGKVAGRHDGRDIGGVFVRFVRGTL